MSGEMTCIQCTIVGDKKVGKSTISRGLCETEGVLDIHNNNYQSTIFDNIAGKFSDAFIKSKQLSFQFVSNREKQLSFQFMSNWKKKPHKEIEFCLNCIFFYSRNNPL